MPKFSSTSLLRLQTCEMALQKLMRACIEEIEFMILEGHRKQEAQDEAFRTGKSKVRWPHSRHNAYPSRAVDIAPLVYKNGKQFIDWNNRQAFIDLSKVILKKADELGIKIRWGGDFNMDGDKTTRDAWDLPHYELV